MHSLLLNILLLISLWLVCVSLQDQYHKSTGDKQEQQRHKEVTLEGMSLVFCLVVNSMIRSQGKHHVLLCFVLDLGGSRWIQGDQSMSAFTDLPYNRVVSISLRPQFFEEMQRGFPSCHPMHRAQCSKLVINCSKVFVGINLRFHEFGVQGFT